MHKAAATEPLDTVFQALADARRRQMIDRLSEGPASVKELAGPVGIALPSAVKHLALLEQSGLVASEKHGRVRTFRMRPDAFHAVEDWVAARKAKWNHAFDRLERYLADSAGGEDAGSEA